MNCGKQPALRKTISKGVVVMVNKERHTIQYQGYLQCPLGRLLGKPADLTGHQRTACKRYTKYIVVFRRVPEAARGIGDGRVRISHSGLRPR